MGNPSKVYSELLSQYEPLIHRTLSRLNIRQNYRDYDDFAQELRLKLLDIYETFDGNACEEDKFRFSSYAGKGLYWHGVNLLRKQEDTDMPSEAREIADHQQPQPSLFETTKENLQSFLQEAEKKLTYREMFVLRCFMDGSYLLKDIAEILDVTSQRIVQYRQKIAMKLESSKSLLYNN